MPLAPMLTNLLANNWTQVEACPAIRLDLLTAGAVTGTTPVAVKVPAVMPIRMTAPAAVPTAGALTAEPSADDTLTVTLPTGTGLAAVTPHLDLDVGHPYDVEVEATARSSAVTVTAARVTVTLLERSPAAATVGATVCADD